MAEARTWMPFYIGDYLADTMHLTTEQHGAYLLLIIAYWRNRGPISADNIKLRATARMDAKAWAESRETLAAFFQQEGNTWRHKRIDAELAKATTIAEAKAKAGAKGGQKRWHKDSTAIADAWQRVEQTDTPSPSQDNPPNPPQAGGSDASQGEGRSEVPSRANGTNPRSVAKAKREAEEAAALAEARLKREAEDDAKWLPRIAEFQRTGNWQSAWGTAPNPNPNISETGVLLPRRLWAEYRNACRCAPGAHGGCSATTLAATPPTRTTDDPAAIGEASKLAARYAELAARKTA